MGRGKGQRILALEAVEVLMWDVVLAARREAARVGVEGSPHVDRRGCALVAGRRGAVVSTVGGLVRVSGRVCDRSAVGDAVPS